MTGVRQEVARFSAAMEAKLAENDYHGGWKKCNWRWLISSLHQKTAELEHAAYAVEAVEPRIGVIEVVKILRTSLFTEAVAVGNLAMMVADVLGALNQEAWMSDENSELDTLRAELAKAEDERSKAQAIADTLVRSLDKTLNALHDEVECVENERVEDTARRLATEKRKIEAEAAAMRAVLEFQIKEFHCPEIHATIDNHPRSCPEDSDDPNEWCISAKAQKALAADAGRQLLAELSELRDLESAVHECGLAMDNYGPARIRDVLARLDVVRKKKVDTLKDTSGSDNHFVQADVTKQPTPTVVERGDKRVDTLVEHGDVMLLFHHVLDDEERRQIQDVLVRLFTAEDRVELLETKIAEALDCIDATPCRAKNRLQEAASSDKNCCGCGHRRTFHAMMSGLVVNDGSPRAFGRCHHVDCVCNQFKPDRPSR